MLHCLHKGGGRLPSGNGHMVQTALSLVPPGLTPVAVFPPYNADYKRSYAAISVIFSENLNGFSKNGARQGRL